MDAPVPVPDSAPTEALPNFPHRTVMQVLTGVMICMLLAAVDQTMVVPAVPAIAADLNGFQHLSWLVSAYLLTSTSTIPVAGKLSDIYGRRGILLPSIALFVVASLLCAVSQSLPELIAFRALQGIGGGGLTAMSQAAIADVVAPRERGRYQGYMAGTWGVASVCGPILGGWMTDALSWRWIFWINLPLGLLSFVLSGRAMKLLPVRSRRVRIDYGGAALLTGVITCCLLVMSWGGDEYPWLSPPIVGLGVLAALLLALLAVQEWRSIEPLLPPRLFRNSVICCGVAIAFLATACIFGGTFMLPLFFQLVHGMDASASGTLISPFLGCNAIGAFIGGRTARKLGRTRIIVRSGLAVAIPGFALLATMDAGTSTYLSMLYTAVVGLGLGLCMPVSMVIVQNAAERRDVGAATGAQLFLRSMGGAFGSTLVGVLLLAGFTRRLAAMGIALHIDLGSLRGGAGALAGLDAATLASAREALATGFHLAFGVCGVLAALALLVTVVLRDLPLQSSARSS